MQAERALSHLAIALNTTITDTHSEVLDIDERMHALQAKLAATAASTDVRLGEVNHTISAVQAQASSSTEAIYVSINAAASNSSAALAKSNGILTSAISQLNTTVLQLAMNTTHAMEDLRSGITADVNAHTKVLHEYVASANATTHMQLALLEGSFAAALSDLSTEIELTAQLLHDETSGASANSSLALSLHQSRVLQQLQEFNRTMQDSLQAHNVSVSAAAEGLVVVVAQQLDSTKQAAAAQRAALEAALAKLQEASSSAMSTMTERVSSTSARTEKLEVQVAALGDVSSANREKLALLEQAQTQRSDASKERRANQDAQAATWNALHASYASHLQSLDSQVTVLQKALDKSESALTAVTGVANALQQSNMNLLTRVEKMEATERKEEEGVAALRERITRLETLVELLMKK